MTAYFYVVAHLKGGSGASTVAVNVSAGIALRGHRVVLVDLDPLAAATFHLHDGAPAATVADVLDGRVQLEDALVDTVVPGLRLLPSGRALTPWDARPQLVAIALAKLWQAVPADVAHVLVDLPAHAGSLTRGVLATLPGGAVLCPVQTRGLDLIGLSDLLALLDEMAVQAPALHVAGVVPVRTTHTRLSDDVCVEMVKRHGRLVLPAVRESVLAAEAPLYHVPVQVHAPDSGVSDDFAVVVRALLKGE